MSTVDKAISDLIAAEQVTETDLLVLEQNAVAKKLTGGTLLNFLFAKLDGHGGILSIKKTETSGLVDTYTITLADGATTKFSVTNGKKGDKGDHPRVWFKYANVEPTDRYHNIYDAPGPWMGICSNYEDTAPNDWQAYTWAQIQGDPGKIGPVGPAPKFSIGSVASLEYGADPWVQIQGSAANPILYFGIPRGKPGKDGTGAPDLSINNPETPGYVAGRTHYWISDAAFILESSVTIDDTGANEDAPTQLYGALFAGDTAVVMWDGKTYYCPVRDVSDALGESEQIAFGNLYHIDANFEDTGEPFAFRIDLVYTRVYSPTYAGHTVPFSLGKTEKVQKLDNVFLDLDWIPAKEEIGTDGLVMKARQIVFRESASMLTASKADSYGGFDIKAGGLYTVTWDGTAYDCRCVEGEDGGLYLGNTALAGLIGESSEPFCVQAFRGGIHNVISELIIYKETEDSQTVTLEILGHKEVFYDKIPEEFLPEGNGGGGGGFGEDGGYYTPVVTQPDAGTMQVAYTPSKTGMPTVAPKSISLPAGANGKSAYEYAQDGGYTGTEEEFAEKLAEELPKVFYVSVTGDLLNGFESDKTFEEIEQAYAAGRAVYCLAEVDGFQMLHGLVTFISEEGYSAVLFTSSIMNGYVHSVVIDPDAVYAQAETIAPTPTPTLETLNIKIGDRPIVSYDGTATKTILVTSVKNPYSLTINGTAYDGSEAVEIDTSTLVVTVTEVEGAGLYVASHTYSEINAAHRAGRCVVAKIGTITYPITNLNTTIGAVFGRLNAAGEYSEIKIMQNNSVLVSTTSFVKIDDIPEIPDVSSIGGTFIITVSIDEEGNGTTETPITQADFIKYFAMENRAIICRAQFAGEESYVHIMSLTDLILDEDIMTLAFIKSFANMTYSVTIDISSTETVIHGEAIYAGVMIGDQEWDGVNPADFTDTINSMINASVENMKLAKKSQGIFYIVGNSTTAGVWTGTSQEITEYFDGLTVAYKTNIAGVSGGSTLNINGLGAIPVKRNADTAVTTTYPEGSVILLTYSEGSWLTADYDANTKTTTGTSNKAATKLYLAGATSQSSSGATTYSNKNCYIGTDNRLYSAGEVVPNVEEITALINQQLGVIENGSY